MKRKKNTINEMVNNDKIVKSINKTKQINKQPVTKQINKSLSRTKMTNHKNVTFKDDTDTDSTYTSDTDTDNDSHDHSTYDSDTQDTQDVNLHFNIPSKPLKNYENNNFESNITDSIELSSEIKLELEEHRKAKLAKMVIPWTEKYRPNNLEDLLIDDITKSKLSKIIQTKEMPNILITGGPGEGKTSTVLLLAKDLLGLNYKEGFLELNASDERGIKTHTNVINFCKKKLHFDKENPENYAKHKIILLDEADNMTKKAQQSISNLMEVHKNTTRFAFTCNNSGDIIEAIQSRCMIFRYNKLNQEQITQRLKYICNQENIKYTEDGIKALVIISDGDMRNAVNNLQVMYNSKAYSLNGGVTQKNIYKLSDKPKPQVIKKILLLCYKKDIYNAIIEINLLRDKGYSTADILNCMQNLIIYDEVKEINVSTLHYYLIETSKTIHAINQGIDTSLQLNSCIISLCEHL